MKKAILLVLVAFAAVFTTTKLVTAEEVGTAELIIHFQNWDNNYEELGAHTWIDEVEVPVPVAEVDEFGAVYKITDVRDSEIAADKEIGIIAVTMIDGKLDWGVNGSNKQTGDVKIPGSALKAGEVNHVYVFQGASTSANNPGYFVAKNDQANLLVMYADPSGSYEDDLGVHAWNNWVSGNSAWAAPDKVFTTGASNTAVPNIKVAMMSTMDENAGFLIYAGEDGNKKTGDVTIKDALKLEEGEKLVKGSIGFAYVYSKGNAYTVNDNVTYGSNLEFVKNAFSFRILPMGQSTTGQFTGTYAPKPNQIIVSLSAAVSSPLYKEDAEGNKEKLTNDTEIKDANDKVQSWFTIQEIDGAKLNISSIDFSQMDETLKDFVVILDDSTVFNTSKNYNITFDLGLTEGNKVDTIEVDLDRQAPDISFITTGFAEAEPKDRIIVVEWNKLFDRALFPTFIASDDRDGQITDLVYVPVGDKSTLNTNVEGDYTIELRLEDSWGNVTSETFIFRVQKKAK